MKKKSFAKKLANKLEKSGIGSVGVDTLSDNSGSYVSLVTDTHELSISFDSNGNNIQSIGLYEKEIFKEGCQVWAEHPKH